MRMVWVRRSEGSDPAAGGRLEGGWGGGDVECTFEGAGFEEAEHVHAEFLQVFGEDELAGWMRAGEAFPIASENVNGLLGQSTSNVFQRPFGHFGRSLIIG